jgi:hypothetical protein
MSVRIAVVGLSVLLAACQPPIVLKTVTLNPSNVSYGYQTAYSDTWECSVPVGSGYLNGLGPEQVNPGEAPSGFDDIDNQGAPPLPCNEQEQILYRGHIQFDLTKFDTITDATLTFGIGRSTMNGQPQEPPQCVATVLGISTGTRNDGGGDYFWDYNNDVSITPANPCQTLIPPQYSMDVSSQVRLWTSEQTFNYGFIIAGPNLGPPSPPNDNNGNVSFYSGFQLVIIYNPALNPRAPQ